MPAHELKSAATSHRPDAPDDEMPMSVGPMSLARPASRRLAAIDFVRGFFMVIIIAGHTSANLDKSRPSEAFELAFHHLFRAGTLGFTLTSGLLLGSFMATKPDMSRIFARYRVQAYRLLFIAHPLIAFILYWPLHGEHGQSGVGFLSFFVRRTYVTDVLATFFLLAPLLPRIRPSFRLALGAFGLVLAREWDCSGFGSGTAGNLLREVFAGMELHKPTVLIDGYSWLGLMGMFLIGTWVGDKLGSAQRSDRLPTFPLQITRTAALCLPPAALLVGAWAIFRYPLRAPPESFARCSLYPDRMGTLFPAYLGATLLLLAFALYRQTRSRGSLTRVEEIVTLLGKTSLFTYVIQYIPAETIPYFAGLRGHTSVPLLVVWLAGTFTLVTFASVLWNRYVKKV